MTKTISPAQIYIPRKPGDLNIPLLVETLAQIELAPHTWQQSDWRAPVYNDKEGVYEVQEGTRCGANLCFAGHAAMIASGQWLIDGKAVRKAAEVGVLSEIGGGFAFGALKPTPEELDMNEKEDGILFSDSDETCGIENFNVPVIHKDNTVSYKEVPGIHVSARARMALGLTDEQASELFNGENDLHRLRYLVCSYILGALPGDAALEH